MERAVLAELVAATGCAEPAGGAVLLCDPRWGAGERAQVEELKAELREGRGELGEGGERLEARGVGPEDGERRTESEKGESIIARGWLGVPTGGTSGGVRFARHDEATLTAAVEGFCAHFRLTRVIQSAINQLDPSDCLFVP